MASLYRIKSLNAKFKHTTVGHDLTKKQRSKVKVLVEEAKSKSDSELGELVYKVRGLLGSGGWCVTVIENKTSFTKVAKRTVE